MTNKIDKSSPVEELIEPGFAFRKRSAGDAPVERIHGLEKGLDVLSFINTQPEVSVADVMRACELPRTTALRVLETLRLAGYLARVGDKKKYRLTIKVRTLAEGFDDESWISEVARPHVHALGRAVVWPVLLATPRGSVMIVRETTDFQSPLALIRWTTGTLIPIEESASGLCYLAFCEPDARHFLLDMIESRAGGVEWPGRIAFEHKLEEIRTNGYAVYAGKRFRQIGISTPIFDRGKYVASLTLRSVYNAMAVTQILEKNLGQMQAAAEAIGAELSTRSETYGAVN